MKIHSKSIWAEWVALIEHIKKKKYIASMNDLSIHIHTFTHENTMFNIQNTFTTELYIDKHFSSSRLLLVCTYISVEK